jgi:hypothetical protein
MRFYKINFKDVAVRDGTMSISGQCLAKVQGSFLGKTRPKRPCPFFGKDARQDAAQTDSAGYGQDVCS